MYFLHILFMLLIVWFALLAIASSHHNGVFRLIPQGKLLGKSGLDRKGNVYHSFLSIPFAKPPVGDLRFADPVKPESWTGVRNATVGHPICPQIIQKQHIGAEDCLYLDIHSPASKRLKPVIVFIHGGSFIEGSGQDYGPEFLMPESVVLVTINYRLGLFGFLNSDDMSLGIPGNAGIKDQVMALRWIKKNIRYFGGNPKNVMIVGQSAGAGSVHQIMLSPITKGLCHRVVAMSGNGEQPWASGLRNTLVPIGKRKGVQSKDPRKILNELRKLSTHEMLAAQENYLLGLPIYEPTEHSPSVEPNWHGAFLTSRPIDVINSGEYSKVPLMMGYTNMEGAAIEIMDRLAFGNPRIITDFKRMIPHNINKTGLDLNAIGLDVKNLYFEENEVPNAGNLEKSANLFGGIYFLSGLPLVLQAHLRQQKAPVYLYKFTADTELNYVKNLTPETTHYKGGCYGDKSLRIPTVRVVRSTQGVLYRDYLKSIEILLSYSLPFSEKMYPHPSRVLGALHIDDLSYLFTTIHTPTILPNSNEDIAIDNMVKLFANFAKFGNPSNNWLPITEETYNYMDIGIHSTPGVNPDREQFAFWDEFYKKYL